VDEVVQEEPTQSNHERARLAAENSGLDFSSMLPKKVKDKNNVVEILEDNEDEAIDKYIKEEVLVKLEKDDDEDTMHTNDELGWEIRSKFCGIPRLFRFRTF
jgi:hypothetical protein